MKTTAPRPPVPTPELPFADIFLAAPVPASVSRALDGRLLAVNDAWVRVTGTAREDAIGRTTVELGHWPDQATRQTYVEDVRQGRTEAHQLLCLGQGQLHRVRLHTQVLDTDSERLLLVFMTEISREHQAEQALLDANLKLQQQVELHGAIEKLARAGHWTNAASEQEVLWSDGLYALAGLTPAPSLTRNHGRSGIHPDDLPAWLAAREAMDGRMVEFRWRRPDGQQVWLRSRMGRTAVAGNPQTDFGVVQDITAERESAQALSAQLAFLQNIAARVPGVLFEATVRADGSSVFGYMSERAKDMLELDPDDLAVDGNRFFGRVHPEDKKNLIVTLNRCSELLVPWRSQYRVLLPKKGLRWYAVDAQPQREADGSTLWYGFCNDVTATRMAQEALSRQHRLLEAVQKAQSAFIESDDKRLAFGGLLDALLTVTGSDYGFVGEVLYDMREQPYIKTHAISDIAWDDASRQRYAEQLDTGMEFRGLDTLFGHALRTRETVIANDPANDPRSGGVPSGHKRLKAFLGVPLSVGNRLVAMVGLANRPGGYSEDDVEQLQPLLGAVRQLVMAWRGHSERKRARLQFQATSALLAEKSAALQLTFDSINQGLAQLDAQGRVRFYNRRLLEMLDLPEALLGAHPSIQEVFEFQSDRGDFGENFDLVDPPMRDFLSGMPGALAPQNYLRRTRDGRVLEIHTRVLPEGGQVRTYTDVSSYVQAQEALRDERQRLQWVLEATRPGIWETNVETGAMVINDRWAEMLGYTVADLQPVTFDTWRRLVHPQDLVRAEHVLQRHWRGELPYYECDIRMQHRDGHWVWINDRGRVHRRGPQGQALYMSGTHLDIHDRVAAQEQVRALNATLERRVAERTAELERSMQDMEAISYSIAHDLRAPLRSVNGFAALIADDDSEPLSPLARDMFGRILRSSANMGQMISDMLELLRVVRVAFQPVPVDMDAQLRQVIENLTSDLTQAHIDCTPLPAVMGDATLLRQLLANLLDNALKYSRYREQPEIAIGYDADKAAFYVRDNGMGFDMARANKLFGLFQRLHAGSGVPGTGVGLAIVARIVERHGGRIWAESHPEQGSTFWWTLPLQ